MSLERRLSETWPNMTITLHHAEIRKVLALIAAAKKLNTTVKSRFDGLEIVALVPQDLRRDVADTDAALTALEE